MPYYLDKRLSSPNALWIALLLAILAHVLFFFLIRPYLEAERAKAAAEALARNEPIEIAPLPRHLLRPAVPTSRAKEQAEDGNPARFAGEFRNRVKQERQSAHKGRFNEARNPSHGSNANASRGSGAAPGPGEGQPGTPGAPGIADLLPFGATPYNLPGVANGSETVLNTDEVHYASFMNRIAEQVYDPWVRHVQEVMQGPSRSKLEMMSYHTRLEVVMDSDGRIVTIKVIKACGFRALDEAAAQAFRETQPYPYPPKEMLTDAGEVHLTYDLQVELSSSLLNIVPNL